VRPSLERAVARAIIDASPCLIDPIAADRLGRLLPSVPSGFTTFGFECRLESGDPHVDAGFAYESARGGAAALANEGWNILGSQPVRSFARAWADSHSALARWIPFLFLEYDAGVDVPCVFLGLDWPLTLASGFPARADCPATDAAFKALHLLLGVNRTAPLGKLTDTCLAALPPEGRCSHVAAMLGRDNGVRLSLSMPRDHVERYLTTIGWQGRRQDLVSMLDFHGRCAADNEWRYSVQFDFDLDHTAGAHLRMILRPNPRGWGALLEALVATELCTEAKRYALLEWPVLNRRKFPIGRSRRAQRYLSHLTLRADIGRIRAKAYFGETVQFEERR
jgi:hypothetical protein